MYRTKNELSWYTESNTKLFYFIIFTEFQIITVDQMIYVLIFGWKTGQQLGLTNETIKHKLKSNTLQLTTEMRIYLRSS